MKRALQILRIILALAGIYLIYRLVDAAGPGLLWETLQRHAGLVFVLIAAFTFYHLLRTWTLQICIPKAIRFSEVWGFRLSGEAAAYLALGTFAGEFVKIALAKKFITTTESARGIFAEKIIYAVSGGAFILSGLALANRIIWLPFLIVPAFFAIVVIAARKEKKQYSIAFILNFLSYFYLIAETWIIYKALSVPAGFLDMWYLQSVVRAANAANLVVPASLGIFEAVNVLVAKQMEWGDAGLLAALIVRIRAIVWAAIGLGWMLWMVREQKKTAVQEAVAVTTPAFNEAEHD